MLVVARRFIDWRWGGIAIILGLMTMMTSGCLGYVKEVREESAVVIPMANDQLTASSVAINMLKGILESYKKSKIEAALKADPTLDPDTIVVTIKSENPDGTIEDVPVDGIINNLADMVENNLKVANLLDLLNESIQANQGLTPIAGEIENLAKDPEFQALVRAYIEMIRKKDGE